MAECLFCELESSRRKLDENSLSYLVEDLYPVTPGHTLVIPKRCVADFFELTSEEIIAIAELLKSRREKLLEVIPILRIQYWTELRRVRGKQSFIVTIT